MNIKIYQNIYPRDFGVLFYLIIILFIHISVICETWSKYIQWYCFTCFIGLSLCHLPVNIFTLNYSMTSQCTNAEFFTFFFS